MSETESIKTVSEDQSTSEIRRQKMKAIKMLQIPRVPSSKLIGVEFDIEDAVEASYDGQPNIQFVLRLKKEKTHVVVNKAFNMFNETYLEYFKAFGENETIEPLYGYTFALIDGGKSGNKPIVFAKL